MNNEEEQLRELRQENERLTRLANEIPSKKDIQGLSSDIGTELITEVVLIVMTVSIPMIFIWILYHIFF